MSFDVQTDTAAHAPVAAIPAITGQKQAATQFQQGVSGNPLGRPPGTLNRRTRIRAQMLAERLAPHIEEAARLLVAQMQAGRGWAVREILRRVEGPQGAVEFDLPAITSPADLAAGLDALLQAVAAGQLPPRDAAILTRLLQDRARLSVGFGARTGAARHRLTESQAALAAMAAQVARMEG